MDEVAETLRDKKDIDNESFADCIMSFKLGMYRLALSILHQSDLAEDAVAEAVYKAYKSRKKLHDQAKIKAWLYQILVNECKSMLRKKKREVTMDIVPERAETPSLDLGLWDLVTRLPDSQQSVITLYYYDGYSVKEIADILHLKESSVRVRMNRGRNQLRNWLEETP